MPQMGRGRGMTVGQGETLRRPGSVSVEESSDVNNETDKTETLDTSKEMAIVEKIKNITSPDDLQVQDVASEIKETITGEEELKWFVDELCTKGLDQRTCAPVAAKLLGITAQHSAGESKIRTLLLRRVQQEYAKRDELAATDWNHFVNSALFLGEVFQHVKSEQGTPFKVLARPVLKYLEMLIAPNLKDSKEKSADEDMIVVSRQLLQNGAVLLESVPDVVLEIVQSVTKVLCLCELTTATRLNLLAALAELWPPLAVKNDVRIQHAQLAMSLGVSLDV